MYQERTVNLFKNGHNQAIRIPKEFELDSTQAIIRKEGNHLIIEPLMKGRLLALLDTLDPISDPFPDVEEGLQELDEIEL